MVILIEGVKLMEVPAISPAVFSQLLSAPPILDVGGREAGGSISNSVVAFIRISLSIQVHKNLLKAWEKFHENQTKIREDKEVTERSRKVRTQENKATSREGQRRSLEARNFETKGDVPSHASRPRRGERLFHQQEGDYVDSENRHLNLPI